MTEAPARTLAILGSTGSIGMQALEIADRFPGRLRVFALAANRSVDRVAAQAWHFRPRFVALADATRVPALEQKLAGSGVRVLAGMAGLCDVAASPEVDLVLGAASGIAGLRPVLAALTAGKTLALANKETLVAAGSLAMATAERHGATILPVDSEHSAVFQCLESGVPLESIVLTASGGPFLRRDVATYSSITPAEALRHPNWSMGPKVTIDSATMMNKGLEVIEARWLFDLPPDRVQVVIHPQSIIHSMVIFEDGSAKAQLSKPDMRIPIQYAFSYPDRWKAPDGRVNWDMRQCLEFLPPNLEQFPCLRLAYEALRQGGAAPVVLNAANEEAVDLFLREEVSFTGIARMVAFALEKLGSGQASSYEEVVGIDAATRRLLRERFRATAG